METSFLLSICIPTFERACLLEKTLESIVREPVFQETNKVEIVVSDNVSKDDTAEVCRRFIQAFPGKIKYICLPFHQDGHINFRNALESSRGLFRKLHNDNYPFEKGALTFLVGFIEKYREKELILCPNHPPAGWKKEEELTEEVNDLSSLLSLMSYTITWIGASCIRKDAYEKLPDPFRYSHLYFPHIDYVLRTVYNGGKGIVTGRKLFIPAPLIPNKYTHNHAEVFAQNYLGILKEYVENSSLSREVFEREKRLVLFDHVIPYYFDFFRQYNATLQKNYWYYTKEYRKNVYYYFSFLYIAFYFIAIRIFKLNKLKNFLLYFLSKKTD
ncbi:MAG: glycosyltransferase family 2 protein [Lentisphaeria bacterium]|nr:glycosyltransferase family 2 protein [Lentisphaeria bacterium]